LFSAAEETFGAECNPTGDPIGGGKGYRRVVGDAQFRVRTANELLAALQEATAGQVVRVEDGAEIDLEGGLRAVLHLRMTGRLRRTG